MFKGNHHTKVYSVPIESDLMATKKSRECPKTKADSYVSCMSSNSVTKNKTVA